MHRYIVLWSMVIIPVTGCTTSPSTPVLPALEFVTATLPPTPTSSSVSLATPFSPTIFPTIEPIPGTTTSEVNLRMEPSTASQSLGTIPAFSTVQVYQKEAFGYWVNIEYGGNRGWVRAEYVQVSAETPVLGVEPGSGSEVRGAVLRGVNVRRGPGKDFGSLGLLNQYDIVEILGKDISGEWLRIEFPPSPDGTGWVAAEYLETEDAGFLPVMESQQETAQTEAPEQSVSPGNVVAEGDSSNAPLARFTLLSGTARSIQFRGAVSAAGDTEDWVGFNSNFPMVTLQIICDPTAIQIELSPAVETPVACGEVQTVSIEPNRDYLIKISPLPEGNTDLAIYEIKISPSP